MRIAELQAYQRILPLKYPLFDVPHAAVETNRTCNIRCAHCYTIDQGHVKSLPDIRKEIDLLTKKRNLQAITLLGGEPTLHPDLVGIVSYVKVKNVRCQLLTNGIVFLAETGNRLLLNLRAAGIDRITVHIDHGQIHFHSDIDKAREIVFDKLESYNVHFSLSITVDGSDRATIPIVAKKYARYRYFDGILSVLAREPNVREPLIGPSLDDEYSSISKQLRVEPCAYIPSNIDDRDVRWLIYYYFVNAQTCATFAISSKAYFLFNRLARNFAHRYPFLVCIAPRSTRFALIIAALVQMFLAPRQVLPFFHCLRASSLLRAIRLHYIALQVPPEIDEASQTTKMCFHCPDATIRNGLLMPVCLADLMSPFGKKGTEGFHINPKYETVQKHLEQTV